MSGEKFLNSVYFEICTCRKNLKTHCDDSMIFHEHNIIINFSIIVFFSSNIFLTFVAFYEL